MKLINKISAWLKELKLKLKSLTDKYLPIAVKVVQGVKKVIESGTFDVVTDVIKNLIKGQADDVLIDRVVKFLRERIPSLCVELEILNAVNGTDDIESALNALKSTYGEKWEQFMSGLAGDLYNYLSDGKLDKDEAKELAKAFYDEFIRKD